MQNKFIDQLKQSGIKKIIRWIDSAKEKLQQQSAGEPPSFVKNTQTMNVEEVLQEPKALNECPDAQKKKRCGVKITLWKPKTRKAKIWTAATSAVIVGIGLFLLIYDFSDFGRYRRAAMRGDAVAQLELARCYEMGLDVKPDLAQASYWYRKSAKQGNADAQYRLSDSLFTGHKDAFKWLLKAAKRGHVEAQYKLALHYKHGTGTAVNKEKAFKWFLKAAGNGHVSSMNIVGECYLAGDGVNMDSSEGLKWFHKAIEHGNAPAQVNLGKFYLNYGFPNEGAKWIRKAAMEQHDVDAEYYLGKCLLEGKGLAPNKREAVEWFRKAADRGHRMAKYELGKCYYDGEGVERDEKAAFNWFLQAAESGHAAAQCVVGVLYSEGKAVSRDLREAVEWYTRSAEQGNAKAQYFLGECYYKGEGVLQSRKQAIDWWRKSANQFNEDARDALQRIGEHL